MATGTLGPILCLEDATQAADGGSFSATGTDIFVRYHNAQYNNQPAWRFVIPASVYDDMVAGTGVISASITMRVYINNLNGTPQGGQIRLSPDPGAFSGSGRPNDIWNHANATASVATTVPNVSAGTDVVSADLSAALDGLLPNLTYDAGVDGYIFGAIHRPTSGAFAYFVRIYTLESGGGNDVYAGRLTATYDAPVTNADATPAAAEAQASGGVGYFTWQDLNYDRDNSRGGNNFRRYLDVYEPWTVPYDDTAGRRAVVYVHGGAYFEGDEDTLTNEHATVALARGYTVVAVRYSLSDADAANDNDYSHPMAVQDLGMALTWLTDSDGNNSPSGAPEGIADLDPEWLVLEAYSAGGHLVLGYALTYDDQTVYQWDYTGGGAIGARRDAEPSTSPNFTFTQGRTNQPRPRALYLWDPPVDLEETVAYNGVMQGPIRAFFGGNGDNVTPYALGVANGEADYNDLIDGAAERAGGYWENAGHGYRLHGMPIGYTEARWGSGRWAPPIRNYGDPGETVNYHGGIQAFEDALENIGYPTNGTGTGTYQAGIFNGNGAAGLNEAGGLSHWQHGGYTTFPSFPHDVVYIYDDLTSPTWPWQTWHEWLEASEAAYPSSATAAATGGTVTVTTEGGGNNDVTLTAAVARCYIGWEIGSGGLNDGFFEWTSILDGADGDTITAGEYQFDGVYVTSGGTVVVDDEPIPPPGYNKWIRHRHPAGGSSSAGVDVDLGPRPSHPDGYYPLKVYSRFYFRVAAIPTVDVFIDLVDGAYLGGALYGVKLKTNGELHITDHTNAEVGTISGGAISPNTTYRLEAHYDASGALGTGDEVEHRLYELHSTTPLGTVTTDTQADYVELVRFGYFATGNPGTAWDLWTAEHAIGWEGGGWIGPVASIDDAVELTAATATADAGTVTADAVTDASSSPSSAAAAATGQAVTVDAITETNASPAAALAPATAGTVTVAAVSDDTAGPSSAVAAATGQAGQVAAETNAAVTLTAATAVVSATAGTVEAGSDREATPAAASAPATAGTVTAEASSAGQALPAAAVAATFAGTVSAAATSSSSASPAAAIADTRPPPSITPVVTVDDAVALVAATSSASAGTVTVEADTDAAVTPSSATAVAVGRGGAAGLTVSTGSSDEAAPGAATAAATGAGPVTTVDDTETATAATAAASGQVPTTSAVSDNAVTLTAAASSASSSAPTVDTDSDTEAGPDGALAAATAGPIVVELEQDAAVTLIRALGDANGGTVLVTVSAAVELVSAAATATGAAPDASAGSNSEATPAAALAAATAVVVVVELEQDAAALPSAALAQAAAAAPSTSTILLAILRRYRRPTMHARNPEPGRS